MGGWEPHKPLNKKMVDEETSWRKPRFEQSYSSEEDDDYYGLIKTYDELTVESETSGNRLIEVCPFYLYHFKVYNPPPLARVYLYFRIFRILKSNLTIK